MPKLEPGMAAGDRCPLPSEIEDYAAASLPERRARELDHHFEACAACGTLLAAFDRPDDSVRRALAHFDATAASAERVPAELARAALDGLAAAGSGAGGTPAPAITMPQVLDPPVALGRFELRELVGAGAFGRVYRAWDPKLDREVAIKIQKRGDGEAADADRFLREARSTARLHHPGIVTLHETGRSEGGALYLVTEFVAGETLARRNGRGPPSFVEAAMIAADVADALDHAHRNGVVHRDVKPSNILIDGEGRVRVTDFGLAAQKDAEGSARTQDAIVGTPAYMAPEQARGDRGPADPRCDVYGLGVVLYELLTGERPFQGNDRMVLLQVLEDEPRAPHRLRARIPPELETICLTAMAKVPARRYVSAAAMAGDLRRWLVGEAILARPLGPIGRTLRWSRRNPVAAILLPAITIGAVAGVWRLSEVSDDVVRDSVYESARIHARILEELNDLYTEIVGALDAHHVRLTHEFAGREGAAPLPATFTIEAGRRLSASDTGLSVRLFSDHPFPWRQGGPPLDGFQRRALESLRRDPEAPVHEFSETGGRAVLRYAQARVMKAGCVECHNSRPDSPKRDWKVGDVRGVLEIDRQFARESARIGAGIRTTGFILIASIVLALAAGLSVAGARRARRARAHRRP